MSKKINYREYTISSTPLQLLERGEWKPEISISSEREGIVTSQPYADETTYTTEEALITMGSSWAKILSTERSQNCRGITTRTSLLKQTCHSPIGSNDRDRLQGSSPSMAFHCV